jgi:hypothetical protein
MRQETSSFPNQWFAADRISMNRAVEAVTPKKLSQSARTVTDFNNAKLFASWQNGLETLSGFPQWKLRLELPALSPWGNHGGKLHERRGSHAVHNGFSARRG